VKFLLIKVIFLPLKFTVRDKAGIPPGEFGVSKSMECDISLQCFDTVGWATGMASGL